MSPDKESRYKYWNFEVVKCFRSRSHSRSDHHRRKERSRSRSSQKEKPRSRSSRSLFSKNDSVESPRYHSRERRDDNRHDRVFCYIISMYNLVDHIS